MWHNIKIIAIFVFFAFTLTASAQSPRRQIKQIEISFYSDFFYSQVQNSDSINLFLHWKFKESAISKIQFNKNGYTGLYSFPIVEFIVSDTSGIIKRRIIFRDTIKSNSEKNDKFQTRSEFIKLAKGNFNIEVSILDKNSSFADKIVFENIDLNKAEKNTPLFFTQESGVKYLSNYGANLAFENFNNSILIPISTDVNGEYEIHFQRIKNQENYKFWDFAQDFSIKSKSQKINDFHINDNEIIFKINDKGNINALIEELPLGKLFPGSYIISIKRGSEISKKNFSLIWFDIPKSLQNLKEAIEISKLIFSENGLTNIVKLKDSQGFKAFLDLWKSKFPDSTNYNRAMYEFYKRSDFVKTEMETVSEPNGIETDRGKVYILNGKPDKIDRTTAIDKTNENWYYNKLKKQFQFETISSGVYRLKNISDIK